MFQIKKEAKDVSTFFKRTKQDAVFERFWGSSQNSHRERAGNAIERFRAALRVAGDLTET